MTFRSFFSSTTSIIKQVFLLAFIRGTCKTARILFTVDMLDGPCRVPLLMTHSAVQDLLDQKRASGSDGLGVDNVFTLISYSIRSVSRSFLPLDTFSSSMYLSNVTLNS